MSTTASSEAVAAVAAARALPVPSLVHQLRRSVLEPKSLEPFERSALLLEACRRLEGAEDAALLSTPAGRPGAPRLAKGGRSFDFAGARWRAEGGADPETIAWVVGAIEARIAAEAGE